MKPIKERNKISNQHHILSIHNCPYLFQLLHCLYSQQYESYHNLQQGKEGLDKEISLNDLRTRNNGQHLTTSTNIVKLVNVVNN